MADENINLAIRADTAQIGSFVGVATLSRVLPVERCVNLTPLFPRPPCFSRSFAAFLSPGSRAFAIATALLQIPLDYPQGCGRIPPITLINSNKSHPPRMASPMAGVADYGDNGHSDSGFLFPENLGQPFCLRPENYVRIEVTNRSVRQGVIYYLLNFWL